jgi:hypothetical protein
MTVPTNHKGMKRSALRPRHSMVMADRQFDKSYIKAKDPSLGLRTVGSITDYARKWGFEEVERKEMPKGNMWVVWKLVR